MDSVSFHVGIMPSISGCKALHKGRTDDLENKLRLRNVKLVEELESMSKGKQCIFLEICYDGARNERFRFLLTVHF